MLRAEIQNMKQDYEKRIADMEAKLGRVEKKRNQAPVSSGKKLLLNLAVEYFPIVSIHLLG